MTRIKKQPCLSCNVIEDVDDWTSSIHLDHLTKRILEKGIAYPVSYIKTFIKTQEKIDEDWFKMGGGTS